jgi:hypothetical protein
MISRLPISFSPALQHNVVEVRSSIRLDIVVKYCGGCNCQIDRSKIIRDIESSLATRYQLTTDISYAPFVAGILACGCPSACAQKPELIDLTRSWIVIAGKTVNFQEMPGNQLAAAVVQKIKEMEETKP